eukprot:PLAT11937.1.p2 GENE.PLAT11937.1~~PLAT11937.1.p2  ORF type:complete len:372 (+),score=162.93 PLAT11937.1:365-1480(+)
MLSTTFLRSRCLPTLAAVSSRGFARYASVHRPGDAKVHEVSVFPGHGIGPETTAAARAVVEASGAPVKFEVVTNDVGKDGQLTEEAMASLQRTRVGLKGEFLVASGRGTKVSPNIVLRKELGLFAHVVHSLNLPGLESRHSGVDICVIRENTEGEYSGLEHEVRPGIVESLKVITEKSSRRIAEYAFEFAFLNNRKKVSAVHKANIMKMADGLFLKACRDVAAKYPTIEYDEYIVDNVCMQLVSKPSQFDVMVTPNLYGSIVSNIVAGLTSGPGITPGCCIGEDGALFEQGSRHVGMDIAGTNSANPTALMLAGVLLLRHLKLYPFAARIERAVFDTLEAGEFKTADLGGSTTTTGFTTAVIDRMNDLKRD